MVVPTLFLLFTRRWDVNGADLFCRVYGDCIAGGDDYNENFINNCSYLVIFDFAKNATNNVINLLSIFGIVIRLHCVCV